MIHLKPGTMQFSKQQLEGLQRAGKIKSFKEARPRGTSLPAGARHGGKKNRNGNRSAEKAYIELNLQYWCNEKALTVKKEFFFDKDPTEPNQDLLTHRQWRFDWAIRSLKIAVEYEGLNSAKSGHTTMKGFTDNADKYNHAAILGWTVLRFTLKNYLSLTKKLNDAYDNADSR